MADFGPSYRRYAAAIVLCPALCGKKYAAIEVGCGHKADQTKGGWLAGVDEDANYLFQIPAATPKNPPQQRKRDRDRAERMRLAGGPMPSLREKAYAFARQRTIVRTSDFTAIGIPRHYLAWMCEEGWLVREGYGLYRAAEREAA